MKKLTHRSRPRWSPQQRASPSSHAGLLATGTSIDAVHGDGGRHHARPSFTPIRRRRRPRIHRRPPRRRHPNSCRAGPCPPATKCQTAQYRRQVRSAGQSQRCPSYVASVVHGPPPPGQCQPPNTPLTVVVELQEQPGVHSRAGSGCSPGGTRGQVLVLARAATRAAAIATRSPLRPHTTLTSSRLSSREDEHHMLGQPTVARIPRHT